MEARIRPYVAADVSNVVALSLRAWASVFDSERAVMGEEIFGRLNGEDWRRRQQKDVEDALADDDMCVWVADVDGRAVGFVAARLDFGGSIGEIYMLAIDPDHQRRGLGSELTSVATEWIRAAGLSIAMIDTGGDPGHEPARRLYEQAGYTPMPIVRYFKAL
ncbi:MAG: GNAT family N-acetyltransferase [Actinomycetota bacterium]|jgi:ribosomal protein S18 acetylase RimI-like enzyme